MSPQLGNKDASLKTLLLTIDVEDWFQVENFKRWIPVDTWPQRELRVERNVHRLLDLLDGISVASNQQRLIIPSAMDELSTQPFISPKATFFILGWIAERLPGLVKEISNRGHEVASHGQMHHLNTELSANDLEKDLIRSRDLLEEITGEKVYGYRAPSFAISDKILKTIQSCGFSYDSSYNSFALNPRYGKVSLNGNATVSALEEVFPDFYELPLSNIELGRLILPWSGGGYFRLMPILFFIEGIRFILRRKNAYIFYLHPWELDSDQPYLAHASKAYRFRHYVNIQYTTQKLSHIIHSFKSATFCTCANYIRSVSETP